MIDNAPLADTVGVILAGGEARRIGGGDKCLLDVGGATILTHILDRLRPQVNRVLLNANGDAARFAAYELDLVPDKQNGQGPVAGVIAGLTWATASGYNFCLTVPGDAPLLPRDLALQLHQALTDPNKMCAAATSGSKRQNVFALWRISALPKIQNAYDAGERALWRLQETIGINEVPFADAVFTGVNRPEDLPLLIEAVAKERAATAR